MLYITNRNGGRIDFIKLLKLMYLSDRFHLRKNGRNLSTDEYYAMKRGPVATKTYDNCKQIASDAPDLGENSDLSTLFAKGKTSYEIVSKARPNMLNFSGSEIEAIETILATYGDKTSEELSDITHGFYEWKKYSDALRENNTSYRIETDDFFQTEDLGTIFEDKLEKLKTMRDIYHEDNDVQIS